MHVLRTCVAFVLLWASFALLYPSLRGDLLHFELLYQPPFLLKDVFDFDVWSSSHFVSIMEGTRSFWGKDSSQSVIGLCFSHDKAWVSYFLIFFGIILPAIKAIAFHIWLVAPTESSWSRRSKGLLYSMGGLSRWAAIDVCAETMVVGTLMQYPMMKMELLEGYMCFIGYCFLSATAYNLVCSSAQSSKPRQTALGQQLCRVPSLLIMTTTAFFVILALGLNVPSIHFGISKYEIVKEAGKFLPWPVFKSIQGDLLEHLNIDGVVSIWAAAQSLFQSDLKITAYSTQLLFFCVLVVPSVDVVLGTVSAFIEIQRKDEPALSWAKQMEHIRHIFQQYALLDVMIAGLVLVTQASSGTAYPITLEQNFGYLIASVAIWYCHSMMCKAAIATSRSSRIGEETKLLDQL